LETPFFFELTRHLNTRMNALVAHDRATKANALLCVGGAYLVWGVVGWYFKIVTRDHGVAPFTLLAHRAIWSLVFVMILMSVRRELPEMLAAFRNRRLLIGLTITSLLVATNWCTFIYASANGRLKEASLGYFLTPIMNVLLGVIVLRETMRIAQVIAVILAAIGVGAMVYYHVEAVWIPLTLMISWSFYALLRKRFVVSPVVGLGVETAVLSPLAIAYLLYVQTTQPTHFAASTYSLLVAAGVITAVPLILFAAGARHLQLITIGLLQYIGPTVQFLIAVLVLHETVTNVEMLSFACIWFGLIIFSFDSYRAFCVRSVFDTLPE
jgi:chloramphenicol-sensitive protein RarD